ncbi:MAG: DNA methyltransferase [Candidatus Hodarchaeales archaeon]|jgi:DNA modification methylase
MADDEFLTLRQAAKLFGKTTSNISYLLQYGRISKYNEIGEKINRAKSGELRVSKNELSTYFRNQAAEVTNVLEKIKDQAGSVDPELAFAYLSEKERTKHVHRLHPYLGKFIPQLAEFFLKKAFKPGDWILDPFVGSGTTIVEANVLGIHSLGIDISEFNCLMTRAKIAKYDLNRLEKELWHIYQRTSSQFQSQKGGSIPLDQFIREEESSEPLGSSYPLLSTPYLKKWFATQTLRELSFYRQLIHQYTYQDLMKIILSRTARSTRLTLHFELTRPSEPVFEPYYCHKHSRKGRSKICTPVQTSLRHLRKYTIDTIRRITEYSNLQTNAAHYVIQGDARGINLAEEISFQEELAGVFTSPPYVGVLDYHDQHRYAYELLELPWHEQDEIGPALKGANRRARVEYQKQIAGVLQNIAPYLAKDAPVFVVANDRHNVYPKIAEMSGYTIYRSFGRPVIKKASRERAPYFETVFELRNTC